MSTWSKFKEYYDTNKETLSKTRRKKRSAEKTIKVRKYLKKVAVG